MFFKTLKWDKELTNMHTTSLSGKKLVTGQTDCVQITKVKYSLKKYQNYVNKTILTSPVSLKRQARITACLLTQPLIPRVHQELGKSCQQQQGN